MDDADAVDLSKENIQPLKQGRNTSQLGLALQAQYDEEVNYALQKMQESYEIKIRSYDGPDPLGVWVEYISWVEQSFPKHGLEGNLEVLLQKCITALKDVEGYKQDRRFIGLWVKYIEMQTGDRLELYRYLSGQDIGTACTDFYLAWAYEFEQLNDFKNADIVFQMAYKNMAQPSDQLEEAHVQFQLRVARTILDGGLSSSQEQEQESNRVAMASLCPVGPKQNKATAVRVGAHVLSSTPGILQPGNSISGPTTSLLGSKNKGRIPIYKEENEDPVSAFGKAPSQGAPPPVHRSKNKENSMEAGPWNKAGTSRVRMPPHLIAHPSVPAGPSFQVHRDEHATVPEEPMAKPYDPTVLRPRKLAGNPITDTLAIFEPADPNCRTMYPKEKVYAGGKEYQLEEVFAIEYVQDRQREEELEKAEEARRSGDAATEPSDCRLRKLEDMVKYLQNELKHRGRKEAALPALEGSGEAAPADSLPAPKQLSFNRDAPKLTDLESCNSSGVSSVGADAKGAHGVSSVGTDVKGTHGVVLDGCEVPTSIPAAFKSAEVTPHETPQVSPRGNSCLSNTSEKSTDKKPGPSNPVYLSMYNQSITVHTKLAMNEVDELWRSPNPNPIKYPPSPTSGIVHAPPAPAVDNFAFDICKDETDIIRPSQLNAPGFVLPSRLKKNVAMVDLERQAQNPDLPRPSAAASQLRVLADDPNETLARALAPDPCFSDIAPPSVPLATLENPAEPAPSWDRPVPASATSTLNNPLVELGAKYSVPLFRDEKVSVKEPMFGNDQAAVSSANEIFQLYQDEPVPVVHEGGVKSESSFDVFVDDQEAEPAVEPARIVGSMLPPVGNLKTIAKEKENAQKFSHTELEEIKKVPKALPLPPPPPPHKSVLLQPPRISSQFTSMGKPSDLLKCALQHDDFEETSADDTCTTKSFKGGFLMASTPFHKAGPSRDKLHPSITQSLDLNGSIFTNAPSEEMRAPLNPPVPKEDQWEPNRLSVIMEASSASATSATSATNATNTTNGVSLSSTAVSQQDGMSAEMVRLSLVKEEHEDSPDESEPFFHNVTVCSNGTVDPFDSHLIADLLKKANFPHTHHKDGLTVCTRNVPLRRNDTFVLENDTYAVIKELGRGSYAKVFQVINTSTSRPGALKIQKPSCEWEYYICREIQNRLKNKHLAAAFAHAEKFYLYNNGSIILSELSVYGSLLDLANKLSSSSSARKDAMVNIMADQLLRVVEALHSCGIIHGDLKPDNIMIRAPPVYGSEEISLMVIDFGRSIDMRLFPPATTFQREVKTDGFACIEMQTQRPWTYQTDLYCAAACVHCLLTGEYMKVRETNGEWNTAHPLPRYLDGKRWKRFFSSLLNVESCDKMPDLKSIREELLSNVYITAEDYKNLSKHLVK